jgi:hypothetical protein
VCDDIHLLIHIEKCHGEKGEHDNLMSDLRDVAMMKYVLDNYDNAELILTKNGIPDVTAAFDDKNNQPAKLIKFSKNLYGMRYVGLAWRHRKMTIINCGL